MSEKKSKYAELFLWGALIVILLLYLKECCSGISFLINSKKQTDTVYVTKPKIVDIIKDTSLVNQLKKMFKKTDTFVITKYVNIKVKVKDTILVPVTTTQTIVIKKEDTTCFKTISEFKKNNRDSSLIYGFSVRTDLCFIRDSVLEQKQYVENFNFTTSLKLYEIQRVKKYGFDETIITLSHPKEMSVEVSPYLVKTKKKRLGFGCFAGLGYDLLKQTPIPVVGVGFSYNLLLIR